MTTVITNNFEENTHIVGVQNSASDYMLWQKSTADNNVHFEWDSQTNSGYNIVKECTVDKDGVHIVLKNTQLVHFYFLKCLDEEWLEFTNGLKKLYEKYPSILDIHKK